LKTCCKEGNESEEQKSFKFEESELDITMPTNSNTLREIYLYNTGDTTIENISLTISGKLKNYISLPVDEIDKLEPNSSVKIELDFHSFDKDIEIQGKLTAKEEDISTYFEIFLEIIEDYSPSNGNTYTPNPQIKTCAELEGEICTSDEECDIDNIIAKDNLCCLGECGGEESSSTGKIIGWSIVGIVLVFLLWFFKKKYRGAKKEVDLLKVAKGKKR